MSTYSQFKDIDPALIRGILLGEDTTETTTDSQNEDGIMSRTTPSATSSTEQTEQEDLLVTTAQTMANASTDREALANAIVPPTPELRPQDFDIGEWETLRPIEDVLSGDPMYDMAKEDAQVQAAITSAKGITRSRTEPAGSGEVLTDVDPIRALDTPEVEETELSSDSAGIMSRPEPVAEEASTGDDLMSRRADTKGSKVTKYDSMLFEEGSEQVEGVQGVLTQLGYVPRGIDGVAGAGTEAALRSFQEQNDLPVTGLADEATISKLQSDSKNRYEFSTPTNNLYEEFADVEADEAHLGTDRETVGITLAYGIVPTSGLKYKHEGSTISLPRDESARWQALTNAGVTVENFDPDNVITDDAVKGGVRRADYRSDEEWTKAVITSFEDKVKAKARSLNVDLSEEATEALTSYTWNTGSGTLNGAAMTTAIRELGSDSPDYNNIASGFLNRFTVRGGGILQALGRRRANEANSLLDSVNAPWTIEYYRMQRTPQGREQFVFTTTEGSEIVVNADNGTRGMDADSSFPTTNLPVE